MKGNTMNIFTNLTVPMLLGLVVAGIVFAALTGKTLPLIGSPPRQSDCLVDSGHGNVCQWDWASGCKRSLGRLHWRSVGYLLGTTILIIIVSALFGWKLPLIVGETQAIAAVGILIAMKYLIGTASFFFHWL